MSKVLEEVIQESVPNLKNVDVDVNAVPHLKKFGKLGVNFLVGENENDEGKQRIPYIECQKYNRNECRQRRAKDCEETVKCAIKDPFHGSERLACMAAYVYNTSSNRTFSEGDVVEPYLKGCWSHEESQLRECREEDRCVGEARRTGQINRVSMFCCCRTHQCNHRMVYSEKGELSTGSQSSPFVVPLLADHSDGPLFSFDILSIALIGFLCFCVFCAFCLFLRVKNAGRNGKAKTKTLLPYGKGENGGTAQSKALLKKASMSYENAITLADGQKVQSQSIELREKVSSGRFGQVHKALVAGSNRLVAVKIFPRNNVASWEKEMSLYSIQAIRTNERIAEFYGGFPFGEDYWLVINFYENNSLSDHLRLNRLSLAQSVCIISSMLDGLAFLHQEIAHGPNQKPIIVHRDFKSKNILITSTMDARIADLGLALMCETRGLCAEKIHGQVGTVRYMSPEVLEGATDFSCFAFEQIDVYAAALVIWEVLSRTVTGESDGAAEEGEENELRYSLPYEREVGQNPTILQMRDHVVTKRHRPAPRKALSQNQVLSQIVRTMTEMWEHEPDGRITSSCARDRLLRIRDTQI
uniref:receptor protein serine/threonine kinase n=1 Tax=Globodera pallida TaxID=36090 RepID=A0A183CJV8_GLOPA